MDVETEDILDLIENDTEEVEITEENPVQNDENQEETVERDGSDNEGQPQTVKPKRVVRNPQPKLNAETLKGPRGISIMKDLFSRQKFKGKGKEEEDLDFLLTLYSYWSHRLFPKFTFNQCISRIENLGHKKPVITYLKKLRLGMEEAAYENNEIPSDKEDDEVAEVATTGPSTSKDDAFDQLLGKDPEPKLSEEQIERIRINREKALKLREERLKRIQKQAEDTLKSFNLDETSLNATTSTIVNSQNQEDKHCSINSQDDNMMETNNQESETFSQSQDSAAITSPSHESTSADVFASKKLDTDIQNEEDKLEEISGQNQVNNPMDIDDEFPSDNKNNDNLINKSSNEENFEVDDVNFEKSQDISGNKTDMDKSLEQAEL